jgi:cysteinyl-tRNA synthetase
MATKELGEHFDIHGGGLDLKFPHHENEIAQTCGATGGKFANIWMHNGFLNIDNEKMSKSLGNFFTTREVMAKIKHPEVLRFFLLSSHYRGPMNYSPDQLDQAEAGLNRLYTALREVPEVGGDLYEPTAAARHFDAAMDDDFNTPEAIAALQGLARELNSARAASEPHKAKLLAGELRALGAVIGILRVPVEQWFRGGAAAGGLSDADIDARISARLAARQAKNWAESDRIRDELAAGGVILEDKPGGVTTWRRG